MRSHLAKRNFEIDAQQQECQNWQSGYFLPNSHYATFVTVHRFKIFFSTLASCWVLWKSYYTFLLKKCLRPCPCPFKYLSERINWIISSFPWWISKIIFVLGSWGHFCSLGCRIGECPFRYVSILFLGSVNWVYLTLTYQIIDIVIVCEKWLSFSPLVLDKSLNI